VVNATLGQAKMACNGKDVLHYDNPSAGKTGPWTIQTHNRGVTDAHKDIYVQVNPPSDDYASVAAAP
jgi:hypothetical protein